MPTAFQTVQRATEVVLEIKRSLFYGYVSPLTNESEARDILNRRRETYPHAGHHCSAWVLGGRDSGVQMSRYSDDGEPSGTAGQPILNVLQGQGLTDSIIVVSRIFGGVLLGRGGLVSAYSDAASQAVDQAGRVRYVPGRAYVLNLEYQDYERVHNRLEGFHCHVTDIEYREVAQMTVHVDTEDEARFVQMVLDQTSGRCTPERQLAIWLAVPQIE